MTKARFFISFLAFFIGIYAFCSADIQTYKVDVKDFAELKVIDDINVIYRHNPDSIGKAVYSCVPELAQSLIFSNTNGKLKIERNTNLELPAFKLPVVTVYSTFLQAVENSGDSTVTVFSPAPCAQIKARVIGNGKLVINDIHATKTEANLDTGKGSIVLDGVTKDINFKNIGKGNINGSELKAESGTISILGTGPVECQVTDKLTVKGLGTGKVYVKGKPEVKKRALGSIDIFYIE